jgi:hypothetical protein
LQFTRAWGDAIFTATTGFLARMGGMMRTLIVSKLLPLIVSVCGIFWLAPAQALVRIHIDLSNQRMHVESDEGSYDWPISSARSGFHTPNGAYAPTRLQRMHYSRKYHMSPMPYAIFFRGGYAIHGTYETRWLGHPASHGCVRISPQHAELLFHMVQEEGARISISGRPPHGPIYAHYEGRRAHRVAMKRQVDWDYGYYYYGGWQSQSYSW